MGIEIRCKFLRSIYSNKDKPDDDGYRVFLYKCLSPEPGITMPKDNTFVAYGYFLTEISSAIYTLDGDWVESKKKDQGKQFKISSFHEEIPATKDGILGFLKSNAIKGVGGKTAETIYNKFGDATLDILDNNIQRLLEIHGISEKRLENIQSSYLQSRGARDIITTLFPYGISHHSCIDIYNEYKEDAMNVINTNPFLLCRIKGISYEKINQYAISNGVGLNTKERVLAATNHVLLKHESNGNIGWHQQEVSKETFRLLQGSSLTYQDVENFQIALIKEKRLIFSHQLLCRPGIFHAESIAAKRLVDLMTTAISPIPDLKEHIIEWEKENNLNLAAEQKNAIYVGLHYSVSVITGGPGTGKTTIVNAITDIRKKYGIGKEICLMAPTGCAAKRMHESTGSPASTVHSRLKIHDIENLQAEMEEIHEDIVGVDEFSMVDIWLLRAMLDNISDGSQFIIIGDIDQLPSVGPGAVLRDIIASGIIPVVKLDKVFRQSAGSVIAENARKIRHGETDLEFNQKDFVLYNTPDFETSARYMIALYKNKAAEYGKDNIICLSPHRHANTYTSSDNLNKYIQAKMNPHQTGEFEFEYKKNVFRTGDLVMNLSNETDVDLVNGDIGVVLDGCVREDGTKGISVLFDHSIQKNYYGKDLENLELAYATSVHKSQGSEYKCVIMNICKQHGRMLKRNLFYTAITRAKLEVHLVGDKEGIDIAIKNEDTTKRVTLLTEKIQLYYKKALEQNPFKNN